MRHEGKVPISLLREREGNCRTQDLLVPRTEVSKPVWCGLQFNWDAVVFGCILPLDLLLASFPGMGPGATATGHADGARQWLTGCPAVHQKEPGEQSQREDVG